MLLQKKTVTQNGRLFQLVLLGGGGDVSGRSGVHLNPFEDRKYVEGMDGLAVFTDSFLESGAHFGRDSPDLKTNLLRGKGNGSEGPLAPGPLHPEGTQPPRVGFMGGNMVFLPSLELERALPYA